MHNHFNTCKHDLKVCDHCDVAYCTKCKKEWGSHSHVNWWPSYPVYPYWSITPPYNVTVWAGSDNISISDNVTYSNAPAPFTNTSGYMQVLS